ncbi:putative nuclease HARBI1 [Gadus macrocephalus]|uniref:putative nuclease HARBI1 n=1 Tax=Gadus macrocephalus TaxID=80720 RepID=UPI0028CBBEB2|nr:putative nuclease HARBI1 [Gadus macrocephalus]
MAALALLEDIANGQIRRECIFREREDLLANDDDWLMSRFSFPRPVLLELCAELRPALERHTARSQGLSVPTQVLTTLGFLATGAFQRELADRSGVCQSTLSRAMPAVWDGIIRMSSRYIKFPYNAVEQAHIKAQFAATAGFPNVIGAVDCTHIAIKAPSQDEFVYVNRKHFHSINVQVICDAQMQLLNIVARWPGSTHDSFILTNSMVRNRLEAGTVRDGWLLGDRGYPLRTWLMTPLTNPNTDQERRYNDLHSRTRIIVERAIGLLKGRWRCLDRSGGMLLYRPEKVCPIVMACGVLHNVAHRHGIPLPEQHNPPLEEPDAGPVNCNPPRGAIRARQNVISSM